MDNLRVSEEQTHLLCDANTNLPDFEKARVWVRFDIKTLNLPGKTSHEPSSDNIAASYCGVSMHRHSTPVCMLALILHSSILALQHMCMWAGECGFVIIGVKKPLHAITLPHIPYLYTMIRLAALLAAWPKTICWFSILFHFFLSFRISKIKIGALVYFFGELIAIW